MSVPKVNAICAKVFAPISWSKLDTPDTIKQVKIHNTIWEDLDSK